MKTTALASVAIFLIVAIAFVGTKWSEKRSPNILSDTGGEIQLIVCCVNSARKSSLRNAELVSSIVNGFPGDVHVVLLVNDRSAFEIPTHLRRVTLVELPGETGISIWPQDPFVVLANGDETRLVTPSQFDRHDDHQMASQLAETLGLEVVASELRFEGGNIVADDQFVFIGFDTIYLNTQLLGLDTKQVEKRFEQLFGKPVVTVGGSIQPIRHIDLIVTPLGERRVAVADCRTGAKLAAGALADSPKQVQQFEQQCEDGFFGRADIKQLTNNDGEIIQRPTVVGQMAEVIMASEKMADELDRVANQISELGYGVVRVPALIPEQPVIGGDNVGSRSSYPFLTYNNVLLETGGSFPARSTVYLPQYGLATLDSAGKAVWEEFGFEVVPIKGFSTSAMHGGSLRCCTKVLLRK